jgi:glycosyltransferase involved in cell wall biosynthesis
MTSLAPEGVLDCVEVSVIIPCLNEEDNVSAIISAVSEQLQSAHVTYEIVIIDNASQDRTVEIVRAICMRDARIRMIVNTRNFGQLRSPTHAIYQTRGSAVIGLGADFQDPPEMIGQFIAMWRNGAKIVLGVRRAEDSSPILKILRGVGYAFFSRFGDYRVIPGATGFGLYDREVVDELARWNEPEPFFRGMLVETGFSLETIEYTRPARTAGETKNNLATLIGFATSGLAGSSKSLLRLPIYVAPVFMILGLLLFLIWGGLSFLGTSEVVLLIVGVLEINVAIILFFIGLLGEQIRVVSERTRRMPLVIEKERVNF